MSCPGPVSSYFVESSERYTRAREGEAPGGGFIFVSASLGLGYLFQPKIKIVAPSI